ncbi:hypothetical protein NMG60_11028628 [Bertholletia excelsa]
MASSLPSFLPAVMPSRNRPKPFLQVRAQSCRDEGRSNNFVDANLRVLRERIEELRTKERLERCYRSAIGWNYAPGYDYKRKSSERKSQLLELFGLACGTFGLTIGSCSLCLCLVSLLVHHMSQ